MKTYNQNEIGKAVHRRASARFLKSPRGNAYQKSSKYKTIQRKAEAKFNAHYPNHQKAKNAVNHAIRAGRLPRPDTQRCYYCTNPAQEYHHWRGCEKEHWLDVVPACIKCHKKEHRKIA